MGLCCLFVKKDEEYSLAAVLDRCAEVVVAEAACVCLSATKWNREVMAEDVRPPACSLFPPCKGRCN